ncbi:MAG: hypothetical protein AAGF83_12930 [Cyanobacteria bacterium P01_G01_bin.67]
MKAFFKSKALLSKTTKLKELPSKNSLLIQSENAVNSNYAVIVFAHHRDVKVALDDLDNAGFSCDWISLIARKAKRHTWYPELIINDYFEPAKFDFNQIAQEFFLRLFQRGKYLVLVTGNKYDVNSASKIMARRPGHSEVWYFQSA